MTDQPGAWPVDQARRQSSTARLVGDEAMAKLAQSCVLVAGLGGVGSWAAEALARSGVGCLVLVDLDVVAESNLNRQIHAIDATLGQAKVEAMRERIGAYAPWCHVVAIDDFATPDNAVALTHDALGAVPQVHAVLDATDETRTKAALIAAAHARSQVLVSCGATGGRVDPVQLRVGDIALIQGDALLAAVRARLRRDHGFTRQAGVPFGVPVVHSIEGVPQAGGSRTRFAAGVAAGASRPDAGAGAPLACSGYGSIVTVTATSGMVAASRIIDGIVGAPMRQGPVR